MFAESTRQYQSVVYSRSDRRLHMVCQLHCLVRVAWRQTIPHTNEEVSLWPTRQVACGGHTERPLRNPASNTYAKRGFQIFNYLCHQKRQCDLNCTMLRRLGPTLRVSLVSKRLLHSSRFTVCLHWPFVQQEQHVLHPLLAECHRIVYSLRTKRHDRTLSADTYTSV